MSAVVLELLVDPSKTSDVDGQWCVKDPRYLMLTGMYVHALHVYDLDEKGYRGGYRISRVGLEQAPERWKYIEAQNIATLQDNPTGERQ